MRKKLLFSILMLVILFPVASADQGLTYDELLLSMTTGNTDLRKQNEVIKQAIIDVKNAKGAYHPSIDMTLSATYMSNPPIGDITISVDDFLTQSGLPSSGTGGYYTLYDGMEDMLYQAGISLTQPIFTWGKIGNSVKLYETILDMRNLEKDDKMSLYATQLDGYLAGLDYLGRIRDDLDDALSIARELVDLSKSGYENGMMLLTDYRQAELSLSELELKQTEVTNSIGETLEQLGVLTGLGELREEDLPFDADEESILSICSIDRDVLRSDSVSPERSSMQMLGLMNDVNDIKTEIMEGSLYWKPDLALQIGLNFVGSRFPVIEKGWYTKSYSGLTVSLGLQTTLWDGGVKWNEVKRSESQAESGKIDEESARTTISTTLEQQFRSIDYTLMQIEYAEAKENLLLSQRDELESQVSIGYVGREDLLQKDLEILENRITCTQYKANLMQCACTIKYLCGLADPIVKEQSFLATSTPEAASPYVKNRTLLDAAETV